MTHVKSFAEAEELLNKLVQPTKNQAGVDIRLDRMSELMQAVGNPHERLKTVHVAGTSGKTSTCYYIASLLKTAGQKVGLTVSPHVDTIRERLQIDLEPISEVDFTKEFNEFFGLVDKSGVEPSYFEFLVGFAYWYFDKNRVDYAVIETGMGGLFDGTNVATNPDKVCVITDIGLDHMHVLGRTVAEIARQKAGIIHAGNQAFMHAQTMDIAEQFELRCAEVNANLIVLGEEVVSDDLPEYQQRNWSLAHQVFEYIKSRDNLSEPNLLESQKVQVPGRMDIVSLPGRTIVLDGAHNEQKMQAFVRSFRAKFPETKVPVLLALKKGKEFLAVLPLLKPITSSLIVTEFGSAPNMPTISIDAEELAKAAQKFDIEDVVVEPKLEKAYEQLLEKDGNLQIITGSFYLIGQLRVSREELKTK